MNYTRTPIDTGTAITLAAAKEQLRVMHDDEDALIAGLIVAAANEIEAQTDIALLSQTITATTDKWPGETIALPVGPVASGAVAAVHQIEQDGTATEVTDGFWLEGGRYPRLHFTTIPCGPLRISYPAGFEDIPDDLSLGIADQVARFFDERGGVYDKRPSLSAHTARIIARHRKVAI